jgi:hypothetical protein
MGYVEDKFHYEDWEVDDGDDDDVSIVSITNDFFEFTSPWHPNTTELMPLEYWVVMPGFGCISDFPQGDYEDCVEWIKNNYVNSYKLEKN